MTVASLSSNRAIDSDTLQAPMALARARHCERYTATKSANFVPFDSC